MGEDLTDPVMTLLLRDMWDPERLGYPAKVSSDNYYCGTGDGGGVHYNSGVPNHAFAMLVDGKTFNGQTVNGIGFDKATQIYWRAGRVYQVPSTFFPEHADALEASCGDLIGTEVPDFQTGLPSGEVITQTDCDQVAKAMLAVEMREEPLQCNFQPLLDPNTPAMCETPEFVLNEDWESGMDGWTMTTEAGATGDSWPDYNWELDGSLPAGRSGTGMFAISEITGTCAPGGDISGHFTMDSPLFTVPDPLNDLELRFDHYVATEANYDGGNLKASVNGGEFAVVPSSAYTFNPYNITLTSSLDGNTNPMAGEEAYSGSDGGQLSGSWGTSIVDLTALDVSPGDTVQLRWDFGVDGCNGLEGWYVDTVQAFTCDGSGSTNNPPDAVNDSASVERGQQVVVSVLDNDSDADGDTLTITSFTQGSFGMVTDNGNGTLNYAHDGSASSADSFAYTIADGNGGEDTATVSMTITDPPPPAGEGQTTGGGWLAATDGGKLNFGFQAEAAGGQFSGELQLNDKAAGVKIDVSEITSFDAAGSNCGLSGGNVVEFHGNGTFNGAAGASYRICVQDNGEPGRDSDRFSLTCTAGCAYDTGAREMDDVLDGGNIQVETGGGAQPTGNNPESGGAATLILDPLLLTEGPAGQLQLFAVRVYDADQALLANATVTLTRVRPDGTEETFTALSGVDGVALFNLVNLSSVAELIASANGVQSNVIEITPLIP
jgi:hypothetical protein